MGVVSSRMAKTYADRRAMVYNGLSTLTILEKYPTLIYAEEVYIGHIGLCVHFFVSFFKAR
jgi:hypothetical protein